MWPLPEKFQSRLGCLEEGSGLLGSARRGWGSSSGNHLTHQCSVAAASGTSLVRGEAANAACAGCVRGAHTRGFAGRHRPCAGAAGSADAGTEVRWGWAGCSGLQGSDTGWVACDGVGKKVSCV